MGVLQKCGLALFAVAGLISDTLYAAEYKTEIVDGIEWRYTITNGCASIGYVGHNNGVIVWGEAIDFSIKGDILIPSTLGGCPVTAIAPHAFEYRIGLTSVTIPDSVTSIGIGAFYGCSESIYDTISIRGVKLVDGWAVGFTDVLPVHPYLTGIRGIGDWAFSDCSGLTSVTIGNSVTSIGDYAFRCCRSLTSVTIGNSVTSIGKSVFSDCSGLSAISVAEGNPQYKSVGGLLLTKDGHILIRGINGDGDVTIPDSVSSIEENAFSCCSNLTSVTIPDSVTSIGDFAFYYCSGLTSVTIPDSVTSIGDFAFEGCTGLTSVTIPDSVTSIGRMAFEDCASLKEVTIGNSVTSIGSWAFAGCGSLKTVAIPSSVTNISAGVFSGCGSLESVTLPFVGESTTSYSVERLFGRIFGSGWFADSIVAEQRYGESNWWVCFYDWRGMVVGGAYGRRDEVEPPYGCSVGEEYFISNSSIYYLPATLRRVETTAETNLWNGAFSGCSNLTEIVLNEGVEAIPEMCFFGDAALHSFKMPSTVVRIDENAFEGCAGLKRMDIIDLNAWCKIEFGDNPLRYAHDLYLNGKLLTKLDLPETVSSGAFSGCTCIREVTIPHPGRPLKEVFPDCFNLLTKVVLPEGVTSLPEGFFDGCDAITSLKLPSTLESIGYDDLPKKIREKLSYRADGYMVYNGWVLGYSDSGAARLALPSDARRVGTRAFAGFADLESVSIPPNVVGIGNEAFKDCTYLDNLEIPGTVETIGEGAFENCSYMQTLSLGSGLVRVRARAFADCASLQSVALPGGVETIGAGAFRDCWRMLSVSIPVSVTEIGVDAFAGCEALTGATVPCGVLPMSSLFPDAYAGMVSVSVAEGEGAIMDAMFAGCSSLRDFKWSGAETNVGARAFSGCRSLATVALPSGVAALGAGAFSGCTSLADATLSRSLAAIPDYAFSGCTSLDSIVVPESVATLGASIGPFGAVYFLGDAPAFAQNPLGGAADGCTSYVTQGSRGWDGTPTSRVLPRSWNGHAITYWTPNRFDVAFDANGGSFGETVGSTWSEQQITDTGYVVPSVEPSRPGWAFDGWWTEQSGGAPVTYATRVTLTRTHTLYAHWRSLGNTMTATFNSNGGTVVTPGSQQYVVGQTFGQFPEPTRRGYTFQGWWTQAAGGTRMTEATRVSAADQELFAHWSPITYLVRFHANGGKGTMADQAMTYDVRAALATHAFTRTGSAFSGWATTPAGQVRHPENDTVVNLEETQGAVYDLYAVWSGAGYSVRFDSNGGTGAMDNQTIPIGERQALRTCAFARAGFVFVGWALKPTGAVAYRDGERVKDLSKESGATVPLYAVWRSPAETVRISFDANGGSVSPAYWDCIKGAAVEALPMPTRPGAVFAGWFTARKGGSPVASIASATASQTLYAHWEGVGGDEPGDRTFTVVFNANGGSVSPASRDVAGGSPVGAMPTPQRTDCAFAGWFTAASGGAQVTDATIVDADVTFYAHWTAIGWTTRSAGTGKVAIKACANPVGDIEIPSVLNGKTVVAIDNYVFFGATGLTGVVIPASVESIGVKAFKGCSNLTKATLPARLATLGQAAFQDCVSLTEMDVPALGDNYFWSSTFEGCTALKRVSLPEGITAIGTSSFANCKALVEVNIPKSVRNIKSFAFFSCESLADVELPAGLAKIEQKAFKNCVSMKAIEIPSGVTTLGKAAFFNSGLVEATVPGNIAKVDDYCFQKCAALRKVTLSEGVKETGASVWANDGALEEVVFPKSLEKLGGYAFFRCPSLATLWNFSSLSNLSTIGEKAFKHCTSLKSLAMPSQVTALPKEMCNYCSSLEGVYGTERVTSIGQSAFSNCSKLKSIAGLDAAALALVKRGREYSK